MQWTRHELPILFNLVYDKYQRGHSYQGVQGADRSELDSRPLISGMISWWKRAETNVFLNVFLLLWCGTLYYFLSTSDYSLVGILKKCKNSKWITKGMVELLSIKYYSANAHPFYGITERMEVRERNSLVFPRICSDPLEWCAKLPQGEKWELFIECHKQMLEWRVLYYYIKINYK